jgi:hypothetical protein
MKESDFMRVILDEGRNKARFIELVQERMHNCRVYFGFPDETASTFVVEVIAIATVKGRHFAGTLRTSHISFGISKTNLEREVDILCHGLASTLATRIFVEGTSPIPNETLTLFKTVDR